MERLGYYAMDKDKNLFQYEWGANDEFYIMDSNGDLVMKDPKEYEILEVGYFKVGKFVEEEVNEVILPKGTELEWVSNEQPYYNAKAGAKAILTEDYTSNDDFVIVEFVDELANGQNNGGYYRDSFK